jgi:hypothetical protein
MLHEKQSNGGIPVFLHQKTKPNKTRQNQKLPLRKIWAQPTCHPPPHPAFLMAVSIATGKTI